MNPVDSLPGWKQWIKLGRVIPLITILGAGVAIVTSLLGFISLSIPENIVIALLALLAVDALTERLSILERLETRINNLSSTGLLFNPGSKLPRIEEFASNASEICILGISAISISVRSFDFFEKKMQDGCRIRLILLNPNSPSVQTWNLTSIIKTTKADIVSTLGVFRDLAERKGVKGSFEIRLIDVFLPFSIFSVDLQKESGAMVVDFHAYKAIRDRPHIILTSLDSPQWYNFYARQFEQAWSEATVWTYGNGGTSSNASN